MAVQFAPGPEMNPLALALALRAKQQGDADPSGDLAQEIQKMYVRNLSQGASDTSPVQSPWQGAARLTQGLLGGLVAKKAMDGEQAANAETTKTLMNLPGLSGSAPASASPIPPPPMQASPVSELPPEQQPAPPPVQMAALNPEAVPAPLPSPAQPSGGMEALAKALAGPSPQPPQATQPGMASPPRPPADIPKGKDAFIQAMLPHAMEASKATGVDPRLIIAQSAIESGYGKHAPGNNYFGIKSHGQPGGNNLATKEYGPNGQYATRDSFRAYNDMGESAKGYADFINKNPRYGAMKSAQGLDAQAAALGKSGYATDPNYGRMVGDLARNIPFPGGGTMAAGPGPAGVPGAPPVQLAALGGMPSPGTPYPPMNVPNEVAGISNVATGNEPQSTQTPADVRQGMQTMQGQQPMQMAQAMQPGDTSKQARPIPPEIATQIRTLIANPKTRAYGMQMYQQYTKPPEYKPVDLGNEVGFADDRGNVVRREKKSIDTGDIREYNLYVEQSKAAGQPPMPFYDYQVSNKKAGAASTSLTNDMRAESSEAKGRGEGVSKRMNSIADDGAEAQNDMAMIGRARQLMSNVDPGSKTALLESFRATTGVAIDPNASNVQAASAILNYMVPRQRIAGSGTTSDRDMAAYQKALPSLLGTPEGNSIVMDTYEGMASFRKQRADIAAEWQLGDISAKEAQKRMDALPDPFERFKAMSAQRSGGQPSPAQPAAGAPKPPQAGMVQDGYKFKGGNPGDPNSWERVQ